MGEEIPYLRATEDAKVTGGSENKRLEWNFFRGYNSRTGKLSI